MIEMLTVAITRTINLQTFLVDPPNHISGQGNLLQSTLYTFESIYGKLEYGAGSVKNDEAIERVGKVLSLAQTMKSAIQSINSNPNLEVYCSDFWLDNLAQWTSRYQGGDTMIAASKQLFENGKVPLNDFQGFTLTTALMHELTHAPAIVGANYLLDEPCNLDGQTKAYGWACITHLAATPSSALKNAAMFLSLDDWSTGVSVPIPADVGPPDESGLASMMSQLHISDP
ncbi:hypothetical protein N7535_005002 [Penicillium sp. DV-2018c]|nr:hypothetical protein N7461_008583 [Penicillium sp. DV-2018c]KAJ5571342.1 hypothetical protein N7535_005002 [Penicillium sp. DV-2018c]